MSVDILRPNRHHAQRTLSTPLKKKYITSYHATLSQFVTFSFPRADQKINFTTHPLNSLYEAHT